MRIPIANRTQREVMLGLEPEGDTVPIPPGHVLVVKAKGRENGLPEIQFDIEDGLVSISIMCEKEVWLGDKRLR